MSTDGTSSSSKWVLGCLTAGVLGILVCGGGLFLIGIWVYKTVGQVAQQVGPEFQRQMQDLQFATGWRPPAPDAGMDDLLPESIGAWTRSVQEESSAIPELAIARDGFHGTYAANGKTIDVYALLVGFDVQGKQFDDTAQAIKSAGYRTHTEANADLGTYHWMTFSFDPPQRFGRMWWASEWLIVTMTDEPGIDLKSFEREYLLAIQGPGIPGMDQLQPMPIDPTIDESTDAADPSASRPAEPDDGVAPAELDAAPSDADTNASAPDEPETASRSESQ